MTATRPTQFIDVGHEMRTSAVKMLSKLISVRSFANDR